MDNVVGKDLRDAQLVLVGPSVLPVGIITVSAYEKLHYTHGCRPGIIHWMNLVQCGAYLVRLVGRYTFFSRTKGET